jgi:hypothetical protein
LILTINSTTNSLAGGIQIQFSDHHIQIHIFQLIFSLKII